MFVRWFVCSALAGIGQGTQTDIIGLMYGKDAGGPLGFDSPCRSLARFFSNRSRAFRWPQVGHAAAQQNSHSHQS